MQKFDFLEIQNNIEEKRLILGKKLEEFLLKKLLIFGQFLSRIFTAKYSTFFGCLTIFTISIIAQSTRDIGHDSSVYLDVIQKILNGGKYYYDFFENNLPLSFLFTAIPYLLAKFLNGNSIIFLEIFVNLVGIISIYSSVKILKRSEIYNSQPIFNLIIFGFAAGFFLRVFTLQYNEFATKSTYFIAFAIPYISYNCLKNSALKNRDQIIIGSLAALLFCLKPNYGILVIVFEIKKLLENKSIKSGFCLRNYTALFLLISYAIFLFTCFYDFISALPAFSAVYYKYKYLELRPFFKEDVFPISLLIILCFSKIKKYDLLKPFFLASLSATLIITSEFIGDHDQRFAIYSLSLPMLLLSIFIIVKNKYINWQHNWILLLIALIVPQFDTKNTFEIALNLPVFWPFFVIFLSLKYKKNQSASDDFLSNIFLLRDLKSSIIFLAFVALNLAMLLFTPTYYIGIAAATIAFIFLANFYQKFYEKTHATQQFSRFSTSIIAIIISYIISLHLASIFNLPQSQTAKYHSPNYVNDQMIKIIKNYTDSSEQITIISSGIYGIYPAVNYTEKTNSLPFPEMFELYDRIGDQTPNTALDYYVISRLKDQLEKPKNKLVFIEKKDYFTVDCNIYFLENYFNDPELKKIFLSNYVFLNRIISRKPFSKTAIFFDDAELNENSNHIEIDVEVYVRK